MNEITQDSTQARDEEARRKDELTKQLLQNVCICKGISLGKILQTLQKADTLEDVNRLCGSGSGGCRGERCTPKIKALLKRKQQMKK